MLFGAMLSSLGLKDEKAQYQKSSNSNEAHKEESNEISYNEYEEQLEGEQEGK